MNKIYKLEIERNQYDRIAETFNEPNGLIAVGYDGKKDTVIVDKSSEDEKWSIARSYRDAPEIDNYVKIDEYIPEGQFINVKYIEAFEYDLLAKRI